MKGVLFDLDGVFYVEQQLIPGGIACLDWLREQGIPYRFVTNNTTLSRTNLVAKLQGLGLPVAEQEIVSAFTWKDVRRQIWEKASTTLFDRSAVDAP